MPIFDPAGSVLAGLSVVGLQARIPEGDVPSIIDALRDASEGVAAGLDLYSLLRACVEHVRPTEQAVRGRRAAFARYVEDRIRGW